MPTTRVVSLLPSATEILHALGAGDLMVGRSAECDFPRPVVDLPIVMRARAMDSVRPSAEIDARVRSVRGRGESLYVLDLPLLRTLRPDVIFTQDLCGVCSVTEAEVTEACRSAGIDPLIVALTPRSLPDVLETVGSVGRAVGREDEAAALGAALTARNSRGDRTVRADASRVAVVEWLDPPILAGLWAADQICGAGSRPMEGVRSGEVGLRTQWAELARAAPDLTVVSPCSFSVDRTLRELADPRIARSVAELGGPIWIADEAYFSRPGPRLWDGLELLADLVAGVTPRAPYPVRPWPPTAPGAIG
ncbi:MAG: TroA family protein [Thermoplasmata archaeon]